MAADSTTETAAPASDGTTAGHASEFSKPAGAKDAEVWDKHFGKDAKGSTSSKSSPKSESAGKPAAAKTKTSESGKSASGKSTEPSKAKAEPESPRKTDSDSSKSPTTSREPKESTSKDKTTDKADKSDKDTDKDTDPEAPHKKARDLYAEAKKTEDRREARKLYKRAMVVAFGEVPEEFDDRRYAAVRQERAAGKATLDAQAAKNEGRIKEAAERLKPAIYVMRQLEGSGISDKLTVPMVERAVHVMRALKSLEDGDYTQLAEVVARASGCDHDEAMRRFVQGTKVSPEGKRSRAAAEEARREAAETRTQLQALQRQLAEKETTGAATQKAADKERQVAESRALYLDNIESELDGHAVLQLPRGKERVLAYLIKTAHPTLRTPRFSFEEAANRIVAHERKRLQGARHLLDDDAGDAPPARSAGSNASTRRLTDVSRSETVDAGVRAVDPMARFSEIFDKNTATGGQRRRR